METKTDPGSANEFVIFETLEACPTCDSKNVQMAFTPDVCQCSDCLVYFRNPRPTQAEIQRSYDYGSNYAAWQKSGDQRTGMWQRRMDLITPYQKSGNLLDVGAGDGFFLDIAKAGGFKTSGTELSLTGAGYAAERGHQLLLGQLLDIDFHEKQFDVITIWHVLEHVPNPKDVMQKIYSLLKPTGILALAVPNEDNKLFRYRLGLHRSSQPLGKLQWGQEIHLTHFQPDTLRAFLARNHFKLLRFGVDDIYGTRSTSNIAKLAFQKTLCRLFNWHFSMAMYAICRKVG